MLAAVTSFALVAALLTITPGLDTAFVLRTTARHGRAAGFAAAAGIHTGILVWAIAAAVGVSALVAASEVAFTVVRVAGALYMLYLGARMLLAAVRGSGDDPLATGGSSVAGTPWRFYRQGLTVNVLNPKIGVFYVALLPQFLLPGEPPALMGLVLALVHNVEGLVWFSLLILAVARMGTWLRRPRVQRGIDAVAGTAIVGFAAKLGLSPA